MDALDLNNYVAGGYFVAKPIQREAWMSAELLPETIISLSSCRNESKVEIFWGWDIEKYQKQVKNIGISEDKFADFKTWSESEEVGHPNVFYSFDAAQDFITKFISDKDFSIYGVGLPKELVAKFLTDDQQTIYGTNLVLSRHQELKPNGNILGFEILSDAYSDFSHSWLCSGIDKEMFKEFGIHPNQYGLINSYEEANQVYEWIAEDELHGTRSEPEPYYPWLIVQYPIT